MRFLFLKMDNKNLVIQFWIKNPRMKRVDVVKNLQLKRLKTSIIYYYIKKYGKFSSNDRKIGSGYKPYEIKKQVFGKLKKLVIGKEYKSYRFLAKKVGISHHTVKKNI